MNYINHNGDMSICKKLIDVAVMRFNAVKFQKRDLKKYIQKNYELYREVLGEQHKENRRRFRI